MGSPTLHPALASRAPLLAAWRLRWRLRDGAPRLAAAGALLLACLVAGRLIGSLGELGVSDATAYLIALGLVVGVALVATGPIPCLALLTALMVSGVDSAVVNAGTVEVTLADVFYVGVAGWFVMRVATRPAAPRVPAPIASAARLGNGLALAFLAYAGLSLWIAGGSGDLQGSLLSWLRFAQTASVAWLAAYLIESRRDLGLVVGAIVLGALVAVGSALEELAGGLADVASARYGGLLGVNAVGLVGGVLVLFAAFPPLAVRRWQRLAAGAAGLVGLLLGKSVGAMVATAVALAVGASFGTPALLPLQRVVRIAIAVTVAGVVVFGAVGSLRPTSSPASGDEFRDSSASQRIILGAAGLEVFERNPVFGVGWRRSDSSEVLGDHELAAELRARFPGARSDFFPDVTPTSVHNTYIQILAELGLVGLALLGAAGLALAVAASRTLRWLGRESPLWAPAWWSCLALLLVLVWLNDNPLYGGQAETLMGALLAGIVAAVARIGARSGAPDARAERPL